MNVVVLSGRLTKDPDVRYTQGQDSMAVAHFTLAVDRDRKDNNGNNQADFIRCVVFGKRAEWMQKYFHKGMKAEVSGRWQTGSHQNQQSGQTVYTNDCICNTVNFGESKSASQGGYQGGGYQQTDQYGGGAGNAPQAPQGGYQNPPQYQNAPATPPQGQYQQQSFQGQQQGGLDGFMNIPDDIGEELPFS